jgi:hypothetical protein
VDAAAVQPGQFTEAQAGAEQGEGVVPPEQREAGQQAAGFFGGERAAFGLPEDLLGVGAALGSLWVPESLSYVLSCEFALRVTWPQ